MEQVELQNTETKVQTEQNRQKELLKQYLSQYYRCRNRKRQLNNRLKDIRDELNAPIGGIGYSPTPRSTTNKIGTGSASIVYKMADIEEKIIRESNLVASAMLKVMDLLEFLPGDSMEKTILEYRYIECYDWNRIAKETAFSRSNCNIYWNTGLEELIKYKKVQKIILDFKREKK